MNSQLTLLQRWGLVLMLVIGVGELGGAPLKQATVTQTFNEVKVVAPSRDDRPAAPGQQITGDLGLRTGQASRAELEFPDQTLTRLGANTIFNFENGTRDLQLERGTMLLQVPKGAGGAKIRTAAITAAITGTSILLEYTPDYNPPPGSKKKKRKGYVKVIVLEGTLRLYLNNRMGESVLVGPGQMIITSPDTPLLPQSVDVNIARIVETSLLVNNQNWLGGREPAGTPRTRTVGQDGALAMPLIDQEIAKQKKLIRKGILVETNLGISGRGTDVMIQSNDILAQVNTRTTVAQADVVVVTRPPVGADWDGANAAWSNAVHWSSNPEFPNGNFDISIGGGTIALDGNYRVHSLTMTGGTVSGPFTLTINGLLVSSRGSLSGGGTFVANGGVEINGAPGSQALVVSGSAFANAAGRTATQVEGNLILAGVATFNNAGTYEVQNSGGQIFQNGGSGSFNNSGTFNANNTGIFTIGGGSGVTFNNTGTVNVNRGTLALIRGGGIASGSGSFHVASGATLQMATYTFNPGTTLDGAGSVNFLIGTVTMNGVYAVTGNTTVGTGSQVFLNFGAGALPGNALTSLNIVNNSGVTFVDNVTIGSLSMVNGSINLPLGMTLTANAPLTLDGSVAFGGRNLNGGGTYVTNGGLTLTGPAGSNSVILRDSILTNSVGQVVNQVGGNFVFFTVTTGSTFNNLGTYNAQNAGGMLIGGAGSVFNNSGTFNANSSGVFTLGASTGVTFNNTGTVNVNSGTLDLNAGGGTTSGSGSFHVASGATLQMATYSSNPGTTLDGAGNVSFRIGTINIFGTYAVSGNTTVGTGSQAFLNFGAGALPGNTLASLNIINNSVVSFLSDVTIGTLTLINGALMAPVGKTVAVNAPLTLDSTVTFSLGRTFGGGGTFVTSGGLTLVGPGGFNALLLANASILTNPAGQTINHIGGNLNMFTGGATINNVGTYNAQNAGGMIIGSAGSVFNNSGTFNANSSGVFTLGASTGVTFNNTGTVNVNSGTLDLNAGGGIASGSSAFNVASGATLQFGSTYLVSFGSINLLGGTLVTTTSLTAPSIGGTVGTVNIPSGALILSSGFNFDGVSGTTPGDGGNLTFTSPNITFSGPQVNGATANGGNANPTDPTAGGNGGTLSVTATTGNINISGNPIEASTGANGTVPTGGNGGTVNLTATAGTATISSRVQTSHDTPGRRSAQGGNINITSGRAGGTAINITSTAQLFALLNAAAPGPGGKITIVASGTGSLMQMAGKAQADRGTVEMRHDGANGTVTTANTTDLRGDIVKIGALGNNGILTIGGGVIDANNTIKLYATGTAGLVQFIANTSLNSGSFTYIAGRTVTINNGVQVNVTGASGPAQVYANTANYTGSGGNGSTTGTFTGNGAVTNPFGGQPGF